MLGFLKSLLGPKAQRGPQPVPQGFKRLPVPTDGETYRAQLTDILMGQSDHALHQLRAALTNLHEKTQDLQIGIHPDQDGEGTFSVMLHPGGPDLYVLGKAIQDHRELFGIRRVEGGLNIAVPLFDPDEGHYEVRDIIADAATDWVEQLWDKAGRPTHPDLPVLVFCEDDWGNTTPRWLQGEPA